VGRYPLIHFLSVRIRVTRMAHQSSEDLAGTECVARNVRIEVVRADFFEFVERSFHELQIIDVFETVGPVIGRIVVKCKVTPSTHDDSLALPAD
jgi:hypothetical protein